MPITAPTSSPMPSANRPANALRRQILLVLALSLIGIWVIAFYEIERNRKNELHAVEVRSAVEAQVFAEYARSTIKRINEIILDMRGNWHGDEKSFAQLIQRRQESISDISFQMAVIDRSGILAFSNLVKPKDRVDLSQREHFTVHEQAPEQDRLFISKPVKGKISGKWSIQFTRPIQRKGLFDGVLVLSVSPALFADFSEKIAHHDATAITVVRDTGELMARHPYREDALGLISKNRPFLGTNAQISGSFRGFSVVDGSERIFGFFRLPEYGLTFIVGEEIGDILAPHHDFRNQVIFGAFCITLLALVFSLMLFRSISAQEEVKQQLETAKEQAEAATVAKSAFLATMSHEIRTPINGVIGMTQLLLSGQLSPQQRNYAEVISSSASSLLTIINDILDFSKIEAQKLEVERADFDLRNLVDHLNKIYSLRCSEKSLVFHVRVDEAVPHWVRGDPTRLRQVLNNFLANALKFTERGEISLSLSVSPRKYGAQDIHFEVKDTGVGISPEIQSRLFQPFVQADASTTRKFGGTGLGLAICRQLVDLMRGQIGVISHPGQGSTFWMSLPLTPTSAPARVEAVLPISPPQGEIKNRRLMLVEDNPTNQMVALGFLHKLGYRNVVLAHNGLEAVGRIRTENFDAILMDCQMPVMDGFEATRKIREMSITLPIIAMTANAVSGDRELCLDAGMDDYLSKPVDLEVLERVLNRWCGNSAETVSDRPASAANPPPAAATVGEDSGSAGNHIIDEASALHRMSGDRRLMTKMLRVALKNFPETLILARKSLEGSDCKSLRRHAHSIKGAAASLGADRLAQSASQLEEQVKDGTLTDAPKLLDKLLAAFAEFAQAANTWIAAEEARQSLLA